jgi:hypothetical protein
MLATVNREKQLFSQPIERLLEAVSLQVQVMDHARMRLEAEKRARIRADLESDDE